MALILLPDECPAPNMAGKRKRRAVADAPPGASVESVKLSKSGSLGSLSSAASSRSRGSVQSCASSNCSFGPVAPGDEDGNGRVRIIIGGL